MDTNLILAIENSILIIITSVYVFLTYKLVDEQQKDRKIRWIEKQLEDYYLPLESKIKFFIEKDTKNLEELDKSLARVCEDIYKYSYCISPEVLKSIEKAKDRPEAVSINDDSGEMKIDPDITEALNTVSIEIKNLKDKHESILSKK